MRPPDDHLQADSGYEWIVEARGCDPALLGDLPTLRGLFARMIDELDLRPVGEPLWHAFPPPADPPPADSGDPAATSRRTAPVATPGGVTGLCLLAESHLACHTFPEHGSICLNLFCCRPRPRWAFESRLRHMLGAREVDVRRLVRTYGAEDPSAKGPTSGRGPGEAANGAATGPRAGSSR